ncbi:MAG: hypothetical protein ACUVQ8_00610 [Nitrososphaeria archaeon]
MSVKKRLISPLSLTFFITGLIFLILPLLGISPQGMAFLGVVDLLAFLIVCLERLKRFEQMVKFSIPIFNIIIFAYQAYSAVNFTSVGYSTNVIVTVALSIAFATAFTITLLFFSRS